MKRILLVGLAVAGLAVVGYAIPVFAHGPEGAENSTINQGTWEAMYKACWNGDWEAMAEAAEEVHGDNFGSMPYHDEGNYAFEEGGQVPADHWGGGGTQYHMGGGMMSW